MQVHLSFLYVGHTHEDIDAAFSKISTKLQKSDAETLPDLIHLLPNSQLISEMLDIKSYLNDHINKINYITDPLHYKIARSGNKVNVFFKGQQHRPWKLLKGSFLKSAPSGKPTVLEPNFSKFNENIEKVKKQILSIKHLFSSDEQYQWWIDFLNSDLTIQNTENNLWLSDLPKQLPRRKQTSNLDVLDPDLRRVLDKETAEPRVLIFIHFCKDLLIWVKHLVLK